MRLYLFFALLLLPLFSVAAQESTPEAEPSDIWQPLPGTTWQWQISGEVNTSYEVDMYDIDLFDSPQELIDGLRERGIIVICYFSAGTKEDWRPDADAFPESVLGRPMEDWAGETYLDISQLDILQPIMAARMDLAVEKDCDGVEPDNVDIYTHGRSSGFRLTYADQLAYNIWMAEAAHERGLSVGLKNDLDQVVDLVEYFDFAINEQCFQYDECELLLPFIDARKAVFGVEYELEPSEYCLLATQYNFSWLRKTYDLGDEPPNSC